MDPDEALMQVRMIFANPMSQGDDDREYQELWHRAGLLFSALDEWLSTGGFLPRDWQREHTLSFGVSNTATCTCGRSFHGVLAEDLDREVDAHLREPDPDGDG